MSKFSAEWVEPISTTYRDWTVYELPPNGQGLAALEMMNILETKGYLKKDTHDRAYRYRPARPERSVISAMVREFVDRVFDGTSRPLLLHLVQQEQLSDDEREALLRLIREAK